MSISDHILLSSIELKPLPSVVETLAEAVCDEHASIAKIAVIVSYDQVLCGQLLSIANSSYSASQRTIGTVAEAIIRLGTATVLEIAMAKFISGPLHMQLPQYGYMTDELWRHSVAAAVAAENMNKYCTKKVNGIAFTAALMHDIGKLAFIEKITNEAVNKLFELLRQSMSWVEAERVLFGFTHADVGAAVARQWHLPLVVEEALRDHNSVYQESSGGKPSEITDCVRIANCVARTIGQGVGNEGMSFVMDASASERLGLNRNNFELLCAETALRFKHVLNFFETV
ncbi:MAG: HDOD domain-containing protein [Chitinivibrionales bacterium]|nr:HDOD domain-containing protein [Chitinivibrionales bacterium]